MGICYSKETTSIGRKLRCSRKRQRKYTKANMTYNRVIEAALSAGPISQETALKALKQLLTYNADGLIEFFPFQLIEKGSTDDCSGIIFFQGKSDVCNNVANISFERTAKTVNTEDDAEKIKFDQLSAPSDNTAEGSAAKESQKSEDVVTEQVEESAAEKSEELITEETAAEGENEGETEGVTESKSEPELDGVIEPESETASEMERSGESPADEELAKESEEPLVNGHSPSEDEDDDDTAFEENGIVSPEPEDDENIGKAFTTTKALGELIENLSIDDAEIELENRNINKEALMKLHTMSIDFKDIPDEVKFAIGSDGNDEEAEKKFINRGKTFHARKARRHRLRRWQEAMAENGLKDIVDAMKRSSDTLFEDQQKFLRRYNAHKSISSES